MIKKEIFLAIALTLILGAFVFGMLSYYPYARDTGAPQDASPHISALTIEEVDRMQGGKGVQALISYTVRGFEPRELSVQAGSRVRFINNTVEPLFLAPSDGTGECPRSGTPFCVPLAPGDFWELELSGAGLQKYTDTEGVIVTIRAE